MRLWTIQDAIDGDVLVEDSCMFIIKKLNNDRSAVVYYCLHNDGEFDVNFTLVFDVASTHPATEGQCDLLFMKMKEEGYEWNTDKKELKKIEQKHTTRSEDFEIEKELDNYYGMYRKNGKTYDIENGEECEDWKEMFDPYNTFVFASHFYELGKLNARKEE